MDVWQIISPYFSKNESWGNANLMSGLMLLTLFHVRDHVGFPFLIHNGFSTKGHAGNSEHYRGNAVDFHIDQIRFPYAISLVEEALKDLRITDRVGIGVYLDWPHKGFHLDCRGTRASWGRVDGEYVGYEEAKRKITSS